MNEIEFCLGKPLTIKQLWNIADHPQNVTIDMDARQSVITCRESLEELNSDHTPVYGVSTGFGHLENKWISPEKQSQLQVNLIRSHAIGTGQQVPTKITQLAMILLANSLAKGHSGIRIETLERITYLIRNDIIPVSYTIGSLGASGDLAPLAHIALVLIGEGELIHQGHKYPTHEIYDKYNLDPIILEAKEGLALINGTHFITAYGVTILKQTRNLMQLSMVGSALTIEALRATDAPFSPLIANIRGHPGHVIVSNIMRDLLDNSKIIASHKDPLLDHKTQDAYALRCIPQVLGAIWDVFAYLERTLSIEINAVTDNPLIFPEIGQILSGGNFHAEPLGFPLETAILALVELANITEARISRLVSPVTPELPAFLASSPGIESGYMIAHYTVAAIVNKLRGYSHPNITDNIPVSGNQEDHVSMAMNTAVRCWEVLNLSRECVLFEIMMAVRGLNLVDHPPSSPVINKILNSINREIPFVKEDHVIKSTLDRYKEFLDTGKVYSILSEFIQFPNGFV